jgi:hypothetical protein
MEAKLKSNHLSNIPNYLRERNKCRAMGKLLRVFSNWSILWPFKPYLYIPWSSIEKTRETSHGVYFKLNYSFA